MTEAEMREGFKLKRTLTQEEWSTKDEIEVVDRLLAEGKCELILPWGYSDNFQCSYRKVRGLG